MNNLKEIEFLYNEALVEQKNLEDKITILQLEIDVLNQNFDNAIKELEIKQKHTNLLKQKLLEIQNNLFESEEEQKETNNFIEKIKNLNFLQNEKLKSYFNQDDDTIKWFEERYIKYQTICVEKGQEFKSREDFQKIASSYKNIFKDLHQFNFSKFFSQVGKEGENVSKSFYNVIDSIKEHHKVEYQNINQYLKHIDQIEEIKETLFKNWLATTNVQMTSSIEGDLNIIYANYLLFAKEIYKESYSDNLIYSHKNDIFLNRIVQEFPNVSYLKDKDLISLQIQTEKIL